MIPTRVLPKSEREAAALSDRLMATLPTTVRFLTGTADLWLGLQAENPYVLHYLASGEPSQSGSVRHTIRPPALKGGTSAAGTRTGYFSRIHAAFEEDGCVEVISAWDDAAGAWAPDAILPRLGVILTQAWKGPASLHVRTAMAASTLSRFMATRWESLSAGWLDGLQKLLDRLIWLEVRSCHVEPSDTTFELSEATRAECLHEGVFSTDLPSSHVIGRLGQPLLRGARVSRRCG